MNNLILGVILIAPLVINLILLIYAWKVSSNRGTLVSILAIYFLFCTIMPVIIGANYLIDKNDFGELITLIALIVFMRVLDIFAFGFGRAFLKMWEKPIDNN